MKSLEPATFAIFRKGVLAFLFLRMKYQTGVSVMMSRFKNAKSFVLGKVRSVSQSVAGMTAVLAVIGTLVYGVVGFRS